MGEVLFVAAHPDDETLGMGVAIAEHVAAGHNVHVLILVRGISSAARNMINGTSPSPWWGLHHFPEDEGYLVLSGEEFGQARMDECRRALDCLQAGLGAITLHEGMGGLVEDEILNVADAINPGNGPVSLKGHSYLVDDHPQHVEVGNAMRNLRDEYPNRFSSLRHYVLPQYWADPRLSQVSESWDWPSNAQISARALNACRAYGAWAPPHSYAIGFHSVYSTMFAPLMASPRSMFHT